MKSCRVGRAVLVCDRAVDDPVNKLHVDHVVLTDHKERPREDAVEGCDRSVTTVPHPAALVSVAQFGYQCKVTNHFLRFVAGAVTRIISWILALYISSSINIFKTKL